MPGRCSSGFGAATQTASGFYRVGAYIRLSMEDASYDSDSVENQRDMLSQFIDLMPGWILHDFYIDNGYSGGSFLRPAFQEMMRDVREGRLNLVLVKDLSRFGRNYLEAGRYLEEELPALGCRFVALGDGVDTANGENDIVPFINAMNEYHIKNHSDRVRSVMAAKARDGQKISGHAPYGYLRSPEDHTRLAVDEYAAGVVRRIFRMRAEGAGYGTIVRPLNSEGILPPLLYYYSTIGRDGSHIKTRHWTSPTLQAMLRREAYIGVAVQLKHKIVSHKDKREVKRPADEHVRVEDAFPAIIDRETWAAVQAVNQQGGAKYAHRHAPQKRLFQGVLVCADCGAILSGLGFPKTYKGKRSVSISYRCGAYHATCGSVCSKHHISENALKQVVLGHIHRLAEKIALDEHMMLEALLSRLVGREAASKAEKARECRALKTRLRQLEGQTTRLYEDHVAGSLAGDSFSETLARYEAERLEKESRLSLLEQSAQEKAAKLADIKAWMRLIREKASIEDVDRELLDALVERIEVGEPSMVNGEKSQDIRIVFKLVGYMGGEMDGRASGGHVLPGRQRGAGGNEHAGKAPAGIRRKEPLPQPALLR